MHLAVWNVFKSVEIPVRGGDLEAAFPSGRTEEVQSARIVKCTSVYGDTVIVESFIQWTFSSAYPGAVRSLGESSTHTSTQTHAYAFGFRRNDTEPRIALRVYLRVLLAWLIKGRGFPVINNFNLACLGQTYLNPKSHQHHK